MRMFGAIVGLIEMAAAVVVLYFCIVEVRDQRRFNRENAEWQKGIDQWWIDYHAKWDKK